MLPLLATLWIFSTPAHPTERLAFSRSVAPVVDELTPPPWPAGMRQERRPDGSTLLNKIAADAVHVHLEHCERLPGLARELAGNRVTEAVGIREELHGVQIDAMQAENAKLRKERWSPLERVGAVLGAGVVGVALGIVFDAVVLPRLRHD